MLGKFRVKREVNPSSEPAGSVLDDYLGYLRANSSVEVAGSDTVCLTLPFDSLPSSKESALVDSDDNSLPWVKLYVTRKTDGWEVSDRGMNWGIVKEIAPDILLDEFKNELSEDLTGKQMPFLFEVGPDGDFRVAGSAEVNIGEGIYYLAYVIEKFESDFNSNGLVKEFYSGSLSRDVFDLTGSRLEFSSRVVSRTDSNGEQYWWRSRSFTLRRGALMVSFRHHGSSGGELRLVRDNPGIFDDPTTLFELEESGGGLGLWRVAEGEWRDPHPGISYHLEVAGMGDFEVLLLQPELGQTSVQFPYSTKSIVGATIAGPFRVGSRPILANLRHDGADHFFVELVSLDGADECSVINVDGQVHLEQHPVAVKPGKEYLLYAGAGGDWELELTEGY